jgi:hypothetical protein
MEGAVSVSGICPKGSLMALLFIRIVHGKQQRASGLCNEARGQMFCMMLKHYAAIDYNYILAESIMVLKYF